MTRKILSLIFLAAFAAVATEALSQSPGGATPSGPAFSGPTSNKTTPPVTTTPGKSDVAAPSAPAGKEQTPEKSPPVTKDAAKDAKDASKETPSSKSTTTAKDAASSKTVPTSTTVAPGSPSAPKSLVLERALVTLIDDNKVPATEAGMLMEVPVKEGHTVNKDDLLAQIDSRSSLAKQRIAYAEEQAANAQAANDAEVEVAEAAILVSKEEWEQSKRIRESTPQAVPESQLRKDFFNYQKALAQKKQAVSEKHIAGLTATAKHAQFEAATVEIDLRQIRAPFKGEVVEIMKKAGDWVTAGEAIMHVVGLDKVRVKGYVPASGENGASPVDVMGKDVKITVEGAGGKKASVNGKIGFASPVIEGVGSSRQFRVWAEVDNEKITDPVTKQESWKLQPGSVATMTIDLSPPKPQSAATKTFKPVTGDEKSESKKSKREF
jgi:multidrug efflux pump subunit AcrA (membrane-fusion protein)